MGNLWIYVAVTLAVISGGMLWRSRRLAGRDAERRSAMPAFDQRRDALAKLFQQVAAATGKPRGLHWTSVDLSGQPLFAADIASGELYALIGVTIGFAAVEGGGMEDVEAVGNLRSATAVFVYRNGEWTTDGRVIFNLEPAEALQRFHTALAPIVV